MRDRRHPVLVLLVAVAALASGFVLPSAASAAATGSITVVTASTNAASIPITYTSSGTSSRQIERHEAPLANGACGTFGAWTSVSPVDPASPWTDTTTAHAFCYQWRLRLTDTAPTPVTTYAASASIVKIDRVAPTASIDPTPLAPFSGSPVVTGTMLETTMFATTVAVRYVGPATATICANAPHTATTWNCAWTTTALADGMYTIEATIGDSMGNTTVVSRSVMVDNHPPVASLLGFTAVTGAAYQHAVGSTIFVNPAFAGSFSIDVNATDAASGMDRVAFPTIGAGWTPAGGTDNTAPSPYSLTYAWGVGAVSGGAKSALAYDLAGKSSTVAFTVSTDTAIPTGGSISWAASGVNAAITFSRGVDAGSGVTAGQLQRREAPDTGTCGAYGPWADIGPTVTTSPYLDTTVQTGRCYDYRLRSYDFVGNMATFLGAGPLRNVGQSDTTAPTGTIAAAPVGPLAGTATFTGMAADAGSGVASVSVDVSGAGSMHLCTVAGPAATAWSCLWDTTATPDGAYTITALVTDVAGNVSTGISRTLVVDNSSPIITFESFVAGANPLSQHGVGSTMFVNPAQLGSFDARFAVSDSGSGTGHVLFPAGGAGWTGGGDISAGPSWASTYAWSAGAAGAGSRTVTAFDLAGNSATATFTVALDAAAPVGGAAAVGWDLASDRPNVTFTLGSDAGSGSRSSQLQRRSAPRIASTCGAFSAWGDVGAANPASPWTDAGAVHGVCYEYQLVQSDQVGNVAVVSTSSTWAPPAAGAVISATGANVAEAGATDSFTIALTRPPTASVTIALMPNTQVTTSPTSLTFSTSNWNVPQVVTVGAVDDAIAEAAVHPGLISMGSTSTDAAFEGMVIPPLPVLVTDNDTASFLVSGPTPAAVTEGGATTTGSVVLTSQPTAPVAVSVLGGTQLVATPSTLTFTPANWTVAQTFTVAAVDDTLVEGSPHAGAISFSVATSDAGYSGLLIPGSAIDITDNDVPPPPNDVTPPVGGAITMSDGWSRSAVVLVPFVLGTDAESGIASWRLQRRVSTLAGSSCSSWGAWADRGSSNPVSPYSDVTTNATCAQYRLVVVDAAGNSAYFTAPGMVNIDRVTPYGAFDALTGNAAHGTETIQGMAIDAVSDVRVSVSYAGAASGDLCTPTTASGRWSCRWDTTTVPNGSYLLTATIVDSAGNSNLETMSVSVANTTVLAVDPVTIAAPGPTAPTARDQEPPVVTRPATPAVAWGSTALLRWRATDDSAAAPSSVVEQRTVNAKGNWSAWLPVTADATSNLTVPLAGRVATTCFRVVAADAVGNTATSPPACANVPIDDRALAHSSGWKRSTGRGALRGTLSTSSRANATLSLPIGTPEALQLVASTGPRCGSVRVMSGNRLLGTISLRSPKPKSRVAIRIPGTARAGTLRLIVVGGTGQVQVDGVIVDRLSVD